MAKNISMTGLVSEKECCDGKGCKYDLGYVQVLTC